jgi:hypothetical protein
MTGFSVTYHRTPHLPDPQARALAEPALAVGGGMIVAAALCVPRLPGWASDYGAVLVYTALILHLAIAIGLLRWGVLTMWTGYRCGNHRNAIGHHR